MVGLVHSRPTRRQKLTSGVRRMTQREFSALVKMAYLVPKYAFFPPFSKFTHLCSSLNKVLPALDGVAQWIDHQPENQRLAGSIPSQGTCLGCGPDSLLGACEKQLVDVSLTH